MLKNVVLYFFILNLFGKLNCQTGFYLKPYLEKCIATDKKYHRLNYSFNSPDGYPINIESINPIFQRGNWLGLLVGYRFKKRLTIETGFNQGTTTSGARISTLTYDSAAKAFYNWKYQAWSGVKINKIPLYVYYNLFQTDTSKKVKKKIKLDFYFGLEYVNAKYSYQETILTDYIYFNTKNSGPIEIKEELFAYGGKSISRAFGFNLRICNKKNAPICSFNFGYSFKPRRLISAERFTFTIPGKDPINFLIPASGNGFYYSISKEINFKSISERRKERLLIKQKKFMESQNRP